MLDFETVEKRFHVGVGAMRAHASLGCMKQAEVRACLVGDGLSIGGVAGKRFRPQMQGAESARGNHDDGGLRKQERPVGKAAPRVHFRWADAQDGESQAGQRHLAVELLSRDGPPNGDASLRERSTIPRITAGSG